MFQQYHDAVTHAQTSETAKNKEYDNKREALTIEIKNKMEEECKKIQSNKKFKDYSPIEHYNEMTQLRHNFDNLNAELTQAKEDIKKTLHESLKELIPEDKPTLPVTEIYKVIGLCYNNASYMCRVWFTLVPIEQYECVPGDPIRVEWIQMNTNNYTRNNDKTDGISNNHRRNGKGINGLNIPQFQNSGQIIGANNLYPISQWGENSSQVTWWKNWIQANRPI